MSEVYSYLLEEEDIIPDGLQGEEEANSYEDGDEEDSPFDRDDIEVTESPKYQESEFITLSRRILNQQKKLGVLKGISIKVLSLSESRKKQMVKAGLLSVATLTAITAFSAHQKLKNPEPKEWLGRGSNGKLIKDVTPKYRSWSDSSVNKKAIATGSGVGATAGAAIGAGTYLAKRDKKDVLLEVSYKYGKKIFLIKRITEEEEKQGVVNTIFNNIKRTVSRLKKDVKWTVKESATPALLKNQQVAQALTEAYLFLD